MIFARAGPEDLRAPFHIKKIFNAYLCGKVLVMFQHWIQPVDPKEINGQLPFAPYQIGHVLSAYLQEQHIPRGSVVLIGLSKAVDAVRRHLYRMHTHDGQLLLYDLGNFKGEPGPQWDGLIAELVNAEVLPVWIGLKKEHVTALLEAYARAVPGSIVPLFVDEHIASGHPYHTNYIDEVYRALRDRLGPVTVLGYQQHLSQLETHQVAVPILRGMRLGQIRANPVDAEPYIRDAHVAAVMMTALRQADMPGRPGANPSGLSCEEMCQLMRYMGLNEKLRCMAIGNFAIGSDLDGQLTASCIAQQIWYFLQGVAAQQKECQQWSDLEQLQQYVFFPEDCDTGFIFYHSEQTDRWWVASKEDIERKKDLSVLRACTRDDFEACKQNRLSDRLLELLHYSL